MNGKDFPMDVYVETLVKFLDTIQYDDNNYEDVERLAHLRYVYAETAQHFDQPLQRASITIKPAHLQAAMRTAVLLVVYCWTEVSLEVKAAISIYFVHIVILDDSTINPRTGMATFCNDLIEGKRQKHPFWVLMNAHLVKFLTHYEGFCALAIMRSTFDYFQGCWLEQHDFQGYPGSDYFPLFLRRLVGLGGICGGSLFPREDFDEESHIPQIATVIAEIEPPVAFINDLISFYKEYGNPKDQVNLVTSVCITEGVTMAEAFDRLIDLTIGCSKRIMGVLNDDRNPRVAAAIRGFMHGYVTWHLCDARYQMDEVYGRCGDSLEGRKFRRYYEKATAVGQVDLREWAMWTSPVVGFDSSAEADREVDEKLRSEVVECHVDLEQVALVADGFQ